MPFTPAENLGDTLTARELAEELLKHPDDLVIIRITCMAMVPEDQEKQGDVTLHGEGGSATIRMLDPLDCAIEVEDIEPKDGVVYLCTGHEELDNLRLGAS